MLTSCPRCQNAVRSGNLYCPNCGLALITSHQNAIWKPLIGVFAVIVGILWIAALYKSPTSAPSSSQLSTVEQASATPTLPPPVFTPTPAATTALTPAQHLAEARRALAVDEQSSKMPTPTQLAAARWHLETISKDSGEYKEAQTLLADITKRERAAAKPSPSPTPQIVEETAALDDDDAESVPDYSAPPVTTPRRASTVETPVARETKAAVYVTRTGEKYHRAGCQYLSRSMIPISLADARMGYSPCSRCRPPR